MSKKLGRRIKDGVVKNGSLILTGGAILGFGATIIFVAKGQKKADAIMAERDALYKANPFEADEATGEVAEVPKASFRETFDLTWKNYIPAGLTGIFTIGCIIGSQYLDRKQIAALTASIGLLTANRDRLEAAIKEKYGDDILKELKSKAALKKPEKEIQYVKVTAEETGYGELLCYEGYFGRWFRSNELDVKRGLDAINEAFANGCDVSYNDLYSAWGLKETHCGVDYGWVCNEDYYDIEKGIQFELRKMYSEEMGEDVLFIEPKDFYYYPIQGWYEL